MPLETATYISDLVPSNPAASDGLNNADDHMRLIKGAVKNSFPNIDGAVTASDVNLNDMLAQFSGTKAYNALLGSAAAPSYAFIGDLDSGWYSPGANLAALSLGGSNALSFDISKNATFAGSVTALNLAGPGSTPVGAMIMWLSDTLPTGAGVWCWANGGTLSRTTPGAGKELFDAWGGTSGGGLRYGAGDGSTTFNVINMQEAVPVGKSTMGGATSPGLLNSIVVGLKTVLGAVFGADTVTLARSDLPNVAPTFTGTAGAVSVTGSFTISAISNTFNTGTAPNPCTYMGGSQTINLTSTGTFTPAGTVQSLNGNVTQTAINNVTPSRVVNFIIRVA